MAAFSILGIVGNWLMYEISWGFHTGTNYSTDYLWGATAYWVYFAAYVVYLITENLQWLVWATSLNLIVFPASDIYV